MGTNRRYAEQVDRRGDQRHVERLAAKAPLQNLTRRELELDVLPVTTNPRPEKVRAWIRFGAEPCLVDAEVVMWTATACAIRFRTDANEYRCWVWSTAVQRSNRDGSWRP